LTSGTTTTTYGYDGLGRRVQASTGSQAAKTTNYAWDTNAGELPQIALETDGSNNLVRRYIYGASRISMNTGSNPFYYHYDPLGSVANVTNATGATEWTDSYEPYGTIRSETTPDRKAPSNPMKFAGEYLDPTGLYLLRARQYDPTTGGFLTTDPHPRSVVSAYRSPYVYANDQPTTLVDPSGLSPDSICGSFTCWVSSTLIPYGKACVENGLVDAGIAWWTGDGAVVAGGLGCLKGIGLGYAGSYVDRHYGHNAGTLVHIAVQSYDVYKIYKHTSIDAKVGVSGARCGGLSIVSAYGSCTLTSPNGAKTISVGGTATVVRMP
jgi:RHS repeat-associated protein